MYQVMKFTNIPVICLGEFLWLHVVYSTRVYASLTIIILGISVTSLTEVRFSYTGAMFGILGTLATAIYQIFNKHIQHCYGVNAMQLLQYESPVTMIFATCFAMAVDDIRQLVAYHFTHECTFIIVASCLAAVGVNVTCYLVIGRTSPVTYGVTGHLKTIVILLFGFTVLQQPLTMNNFCGIVLAFSGIVWYTVIKLQQDHHASNSDLYPSLSQTSCENNKT
jgi:solute carrier family 35 protein E3